MRFCLQRCDVWFDGFAGHVAMVPFGPRPPTGGPPISQEGSSPLRKEGKQSTQRRWGRGRRRPERGDTDAGHDHLELGGAAPPTSGHHQRQQPSTLLTGQVQLGRRPPWAS